jgi:hypothetical protein
MWIHFQTLSGQQDILCIFQGLRIAKAGKPLPMVYMAHLLSHYFLGQNQKGTWSMWSNQLLR